MAETLRVLLVGADREFVDPAAERLARAGDLAVETAEGLDALDRVGPRDVDCLVLGGSPPTSTPDLVERVRGAAPGVPVVVLAGPDGPSVAAALDAGADDCLPAGEDRDWDRDALAARIRRAVRERQADAAGGREEAFQRLARRAPVPAVVYTDDGVVFPNAAALDFFGVEGFGPLVGRDPADAFGADADLAARFAGVLDDGEGFGPVEHRFVAEDGRERVCRLSVAPATHEGVPAGRVLVEDLTDARAASDDRDRERRRLDAALGAFEGVAYVADGDGRLLRWNDRLAAVWGRSDRELEGLPVAEVIDSGTDEDGRGEPRTAGAFEGRLRTADGEELPVAVREVPVADDGGRPAGRVGMGWVTGDRSGGTEDGGSTAGSGPSGGGGPADSGFDRARERRLDRLRTVVRHVPVALFVLDAGGTVELAEGESLAALGIDPATAVGRSAPDLVGDPDLRAACRRALDGSAAEVTVESGDRAVEVRLAPVDGGREVVGTAIEVTDRRERERELERYRTLVEAAGDAMYALDADGNMTMVNEAQTEFTGVDREELLDTNVAEYMRPEDLERGTEAIRGLLSDDDRDVARFEIRGEGDRFPGEGETVYEDIVAVLTDDDGEFRGSVGVLRDVTERKRRERELRRKNERLEEFASVVAHDLRGPLSVAYTDLETALDTGDDDRIRDALASLDRMDQLLGDLLTLARQGETVDEAEPVDLADLAREAWDDTDAAGGQLLVDDPGTVEADPTRVRELFENLFRNAVEHGSRGDPSESGEGVTVRVGSLPDRPGFFVADDGPGIPPDEREAVFEHGYTLGDEGTGFGLAIVDGIARAHGWSVSVVESADGGARFEVGTAVDADAPGGE